MKLDRQAATPLYFQIREYCKEQIETKAWSKGDIIPSETELAAQFKVSRSTVRQAIMELVRLGYLERTPGKGTTVVEPKVQPLMALTSFSENMQASGITPSYDTLDVKIVTITSDSVANFLGEEVGSKALYIHRLLIADGEPLALAESYIPLSLIEDKAPLFTKDTLDQISLFKLLAEECGVELWRADEFIDASLAFDDEAKLLAIPRYQPIVVIRRQSYDKNDFPVEYVKLIFRADRYRYKLSLSRSQFEDSGKARDNYPG